MLVTRVPWSVLTARGCFVLGVGIVTIACPADAGRLEFDRALHKRASQTSVDWGGDASRATDGSTDGNYANGSVTHTLDEFQPYWQVDLGGSYNIDTIEFFNRTDCCGERLNNLFVFLSNSPLTLRGASDTFQHADVTTRLVFGTAPDHRVVQVGTWARYIRIQLAGSGILSLAEVRAIERITVDGPAAFAAATSWVATGVRTDAAAFRIAEMDGALCSAQRGLDGRLHIAREVAVDGHVPGSPLITTDAPAIAVEPRSNQVFIAVRGTDGGLHVATGAPPAMPETPRTWTWERLAETEAAPSLAVAGEHVVVAWLQATHVRSTWKTAAGSTWATPTSHSDATTPPALARNKNRALGIAFLRRDGSINFIKGHIDGTAHWGATEPITGTSNGDRVGLAAWGELFVVSAIGTNDRRAYVAVQQYRDGVPQWDGFEPAWGAMDVPLSEVPTVSVFGGVIFLLGRDGQQALRCWIRNPNTISYRYGADQMWLGGRIVGGWGAGATPPALAAVGVSTVWGVWGSPSEFYVATRGIDDGQIFTLNLGRFIALDVLNKSYGIRLRGNDSVPELHVASVQNLFEHMVGFLALPGADAWTTTSRNRACNAAKSGVEILLHTATAGQTRARQCPPVMFLNASYQSASYMFHEWMHMDHARRSLASRPGYQNTFGNPRPRQCDTDADCGGEPCIDADPSYNEFDDASIRRWIGKKACVVDGRPQGHTTFYAIESAEHDFIETAQRYRWEGDILRRQARRDLDHGSPRLWNMYVWLRDNYFDGIEYNGNGDPSGEMGNRSLGWWGMPLP